MQKFGTRTSQAITVVGLAFTCLAFTSGCTRDPNVRKHKYLDSGKHYEDQGKLKEAAIQFANALKVDHNFAEAHYEMSKVYMKMGEVRAGYGELMRTVELQPNNLQAHFDLGTLYMAANDPAKAADQVKIIMSQNPNYADAYALQAALDARNGDRAAALTSIQKALTLDPNNAKYHTTLGLIDSTDPTKSADAESELRKAVSIDGKFVHARLMLASLLEKKGDISGAERELQAAIQQSPTDLSARANLAGLYLRAGDKGKAEQTMRKSVEDNPDQEEPAKMLRDFYYQSHQVPQAEATFADLSAKYPKSFAIRIVYADILTSKGDFAKLKPLADDIVKKNGSKPQAQVLQATMLLHDGKVNDAFDLLQKAAKTNEDNVQLQLAFARVSEMKGDMNSAEAAYSTVERVQPMNAPAQIGLAQLSAARKDWTRLGQIADKVLSVNPNYSQAYVWRGISEENQQQFPKAEADFQEAMKRDTVGSSGYQQLGLLKLHEGKFADAITNLEVALTREPNSVPALAGIAQAYGAQKQMDKAIARIQQQISKVPQNGSFYAMLADAQRATKDYAGAKVSARKAIDMNQNDFAAVQEYAGASMSLGDVDGAIGAWEKWSKDHPHDATPLSMLGTLNEQKGNASKAQEYYKQALALNPNDGMSANNLAYLMVTTGQNADVALSYAQTARRVLPENADSADTLAWVYYYKGTYFSARDLLEAALKQSPNNASVHYHLGMTYSKLGRKADAVTQLKKAQELGAGTKVATDAASALNQLG